jgi:hypothetical protein
VVVVVGERRKRKAKVIKYESSLAVVSYPVNCRLAKSNGDEATSK